MSMLDQHRRQLAREREKRLRLSKDTQALGRRLSEKSPKVASASSESTRRSRLREVERLERDLVRAQARVLAQDKVISTLETKIARGEEAEQRQREQAEAQRGRERARRDQTVARELDSLTAAAAALDERLTAVEASSLATLAFAVSADRVKRQYDVFLSYATPDETLAANLRDELQARALDVWMADAQVPLGASLVTGIDEGIGSSRCGICLVTPAYIDPKRFWPRQELAALIMGRKRVIPVVAGLSFEEVEDFSALLGDRKGLSTDGHGLDEIAELIAESLATTA